VCIRKKDRSLVLQKRTCQREPVFVRSELAKTRLARMAGQMTKYLDLEIGDAAPATTVRGAAQRAACSDWRGEKFIAIPHRQKSHKSEAVRQEEVRIGNRRARVIQLLRGGMSRVDIAESLGVSKATVNSDLKSLGVKR